MAPVKPSLDLLRSLTDEHVLRALMAERQLTRAQLALRTGISKPTVSESIRRLSEAGLVRDTGERTRGRGRTGSYFALAGDLGTALVVSIAPGGVLAEIIDVRGDVSSRAMAQVARQARPAEVSRVLEAVVRRVQAGNAPARLAVLSAADAVDRQTGRLVYLPDNPFLLGELSPRDVLKSFVDGPVAVDNDVNWAARAEREAGDPGALDDFVYVYLGDGIGAAVVSDGEVRRGYTGLAGEMAHLVTWGPNGRAVAFINVFAQLGLRRPGSTAVDSEALLERAGGGSADSRRLRTALGRAVCGALVAFVAIAEPGLFVLGGTWGPALLDAIADQFERLPRHVPIQPARVINEPSQVGARAQATLNLRATVLAQLRPS